MLSITKRINATGLLSEIEQMFSHAPAMDIAELIKLKRAESGMSQRELAKRLGVTPGAVGQWETGASLPTNENMAAIKLFLNIKTDVAVAPGSPYAGQLIDAPDQLAWLQFWRDLTPAKRDAVIELLQIGRPPPK